MSFVKEAWPFVIPFVVLAVLLMAFGSFTSGGISLLVAFLVLLFFRDPKRRYDGPDEIVLAPADGVVTQLDRVEDLDVGPGERRRIVTFLNVFDVHVQRTPVEGQVEKTAFTKGRKVAAFRPDADKVNENHLTVLKRREGDLIGIRQIAGLVARRVVPYLSEGRTVARGEHLGVIKFGSRVDLILPSNYEILVEIGDRLEAGSTAVAMPTDPSSPPPEPPDRDEQVPGLDSSR